MLRCAHSNLQLDWIYTINADALLLLEWPQVGATESRPLVLLLYRPAYKSGD